MKQELKDALETLALKLASDAFSKLTHARKSVILDEQSEHLKSASELAQAASACAHEVEWAMSWEEHAPPVEDSSYEELKALVVPLAEQAASCIDADTGDASVFLYGCHGVPNVTCGQIRRLCRAVGVGVPDAPA